MPGHLVHCGRSSAYDANFGKEAGAAAVPFLSNGINGVTLVGVNGKRYAAWKPGNGQAAM